MAAVIAVAGTVVLTQDDHAAAHSSRSAAASHPSASAAPKSGGVFGTLLLSDSDGYGIADDGAGGCEGSGGYSDISEGAQVVISDGSSTTLGLGTLDAGIWSGSDCSFSFSITDIPTGKNFYGVAVSHRGTVQFTEPQLFGSGVSLTLGS